MSRVSGLLREPSPPLSGSRPAEQSDGETYVGTPSFSNCSRVATPPLPRVETNEAVTKSGSMSRAFSKDGALSARRGTVAFAFSRPFITGSVQVAVPAMRSARPRESRISVVPWLRERARFGVDFTVTLWPQLSMVRG